MLRHEVFCVSIASINEQLDRLRLEREHVARVLATFYNAPVSLSSVQAILDLARELNPSLAPREEK